MKKVIVLKKIFVLLFVLTVFFVSCTKKPFDTIPTEEPTQPTLPDAEYSDSQPEYEIHPIVETMFEDNKARLSFDDIIKSISDDNMTAKLIDESRADAKISTGDDVYYSVKPNVNSNIRISALDTFIEILNRCEYIETESLSEPILYVFIFQALDINGEENEICVYVTRSCIKFAYNGISDDKEYANMSDNDNYKNVCYGYDHYIRGIIPDKNGQRATIW